MKKRLFISSILMTLVLLVAITTATFAWYQASAGSLASATGSDTKSSITTQTTIAGPGTLTESLAVTLAEVSIKPAAGNNAAENWSSKLQLIGFDEDGVVEHYYWQNSSLVPYSGEAGHYDCAVYSITATAALIKDGNNNTLLTKDEVIALLQKASFTITAAVTNETTDYTGRMKYYFAAASDVLENDEFNQDFAPVAQDPTAGTGNTTLSISANNNLDWDSTVLGYLVVYFDGGDANQKDVSNSANVALQGDITVTVTMNQ